MSDEELLFVHVRWHGDIKEADHHLFVGLATPANFGIRVRIVRVVLAVIKPGNCLQLGARLQKTRLCQSVTELPVEVIVVQPQQRFNRAVWMENVVLESLSAQMHVRKEAEQRAVVWQSTPDVDPV